MISKFINKLINSLSKNNVSTSNIINYGNGKTVIRNSVVGGSITINGNNITGINSENLIKGNGNLISIKRDIEDFSSIMLESSISVNLIISEEKNCEIIADENILDLIEVNVKKGVLKVGIKENSSFTTSNKISVNITNPKLNEVSLCGSSNISVSKISQDMLSVTLKGSGDIDLSGEVNNLYVNLTGSGDIDAEDLISKSVIVNLKGSGSVESTAIESANVNLVGSGNVKIYGKTLRTNKNVMGSGNVKFK